MALDFAAKIIKFGIVFRILLKFSELDSLFSAVIVLITCLYYNNLLLVVVLLLFLHMEI